MASSPFTTPSFEFRTDDATVGSRLVLGLANPGMVGLTAVDYLVAHLDTAQVGHVGTRDLPDITPFTDGTPRHPIRLYTAPDADVTLLVSEVFFPIGVAEPFVDGLLAFADDHGIEEVTALQGVPFPHGPDEHAVSSVAIEDYRERHREDEPIPPLDGGFSDGILGELMIRGLEGDVPAVGTLVTPSHPPGPDFDGALLVLAAVETLCDVDVDASELERRSEELRRHYEELAERMQALSEGDAGLGRDYPEDRMYM